VRFEGKRYFVKVGIHDTIGVLKRRLYDLVGVFPGYQSLTKDEDENELADRMFAFTCILTTYPHFLLLPSTLSLHPPAMLISFDGRTNAKISIQTW
jgi:hypothetical protein